MLRIALPAADGRETWLASLKEGDAVFIFGWGGVSLARIIHECPALLCLSATFRFNAPFMTGTASADQDGHLVYGQFARNF